MALTKREAGEAKKLKSPEAKKPRREQAEKPESRAAEKLEKPRSRRNQQAGKPGSPQQKHYSLLLWDDFMPVPITTQVACPLPSC